MPDSFTGLAIRSQAYLKSAAVTVAAVVELGFAQFERPHGGVRVRFPFGGHVRLDLAGHEVELHQAVEDGLYDLDAF